MGTNLFNDPNLLLGAHAPEDDGAVAAAAGKGSLVYRVPGHGTRLLFVTTERLHFLLQVSIQKKRKKLKEVPNLIDVPYS